MALLTDKEVGRMLGMSASTIRVQRHYRGTGSPHWFTVDAVYIGSSPRYKLEEVEAWVAAQLERRNDSANAVETRHV